VKLHLVNNDPDNRLPLYSQQWNDMVVVMIIYCEASFSLH
jgi:hypothetical protein